MKAQPPIIRIDTLSKRFGKGPLILDSIDFQVQRDEFVSLIGPSGCGKSTILRLLAGLTPPTSGEIVIDGMTPENAREESFFVFQEPNLLP